MFCLLHEKMETKNNQHFWSFVTKTFDILPEIIMEYQI